VPVEGRVLVKVSAWSTSIFAADIEGVEGAVSAVFTVNDRVCELNVKGDVVPVSTPIMFQLKEFPFVRLETMKELVVVAPTDVPVTVLNVADPVMLKNLIVTVPVPPDSVVDTTCFWPESSSEFAEIDTLGCECAVIVVVITDVTWLALSTTLAVNVSEPMAFASIGSVNAIVFDVAEFDTNALNMMFAVFEFVTRKL
jgi:hypothetical protein